MKRLGDILVESGFLNASELAEALSTQKETGKRLGEVIVESGPDGLPRSVGLSSSLNSLGVPLLRFKTGTPVRVNSNSVRQIHGNATPWHAERFHQGGIRNVNPIVE